MVCSGFSFMASIFLTRTREQYFILQQYILETTVATHISTTNCKILQKFPIPTIHACKIVELV